MSLLVHCALYARSSSSSCSSLVPHINNSLCSSLFCSAPVCFSPAACHAAFPTPTAFQHFPQSLAVEMQLGLLLPSHLLPLPEGWRSLFCCSHVLILPDKPEEKLLHCDVKLFVHLHCCCCPAELNGEIITIAKDLARGTGMCSRKSPAR